jgi:flagellar operon protein
MSSISNELKNIIVNHPQAPAEYKNSKKIDAGSGDEFSKIFDTKSQDVSSNLQEISLSQHAQKRLEQRSINLDSNEYMKLKQALQSLQHKGGKESLVVTDKAAYIMDVANKKIVTAMNKQELQDNVFTKIDSTVFV